MLILKLFSRLMWRDLLKNKTFSVLFVLTMSMGMIGFVFIHYFKTAMEVELSSRSRDIMSSDLSLSSRRATSELEKSKVDFVLKDKTLGQYDILEMYSMLYAGDQSKLVDLKTLPVGYPFYGRILLEDGTIYSYEKFKDQVGVFIDKNLARLMSLKAGEDIKLGEATLPIIGVVQEDSSQAVVGFSLGPRIYLSPSALVKTSLVRPGSTIRYSTHFKLKPMSDDALAAVKLSLKATLLDDALRVRTHHDASEDLARTTTQFNDFLALISIVSLFLAGIGSQFLFRHFLLRHLRVTGLLSTLGLTKRSIVGFYIAQMSMLSFAAFVLSVVVNFLCMPILSVVLKERFGINLIVDREILFSLVLQTFWLAPILSLFLSLPLFHSLYKLQVSRLFHGRLLFDKMPWKQGLVLYLPAVFLFYGLSLVESQSLMVGTLFFVLLFVSVILIALCLQVLFVLGEKITKNFSPFWRLPFLYLKRNRVSTLSYFLALGLGTLLITLVPTLERTIRAEMMTPGKSTVPNLFLFDIQPEQLAPLEETLRESNHELSFKSPMVRGRLLKINGAEHRYKAKKGLWNSLVNSRAEENKERLMSRVLNFSFRQNFSDAEEIIAGRPFNGTFSWDTGKPVEVSLEKRFAERYDIKMGDKLSFDIQDVELEGVVVSLRSVKWLSFQPNFFIQFQPGALDDAPKTYLGAINRLSVEETLMLQKKIGRKFSNISLIDVKDSLSKMTDLMEQMGIGLRMMALLCISVGFLVIYCLSQSSVFERLPSFNMFKVLGLESRKVQEMVLLEFGVVSFFSALMGFLLSLAVSGILSQVLFERLPVIPWGTLFLMIGGVTGFSLLVSFISIHRLMQEKPSILLRELASQS